MIELCCPQPTHQIETRQDDDGAGQQAEDRHGGVLFGPGAAPGAPPIGAPEPAITSTSSACSGQGGVGALAPAAGGTGRGLGQRPAGRCGGRGPAGFSRPRRLAAARFPAVLCRAARARPQLGRSIELTRGFELPTPPAKWGGCWRRPRWPRTRPQWRSCKPLGPAGWEGTLRTTVGRSRWPRWAAESGNN